MKKLYSVLIHFVSFLFLFGIVMYSFGNFINISDSEVYPINIVTVGAMIVFLVLWIVNYLIQMKKKGWKTFFVGNILFLLASTIIILLLVPFLYQILYF